MEGSADVLELTALPPLSPTMERAFTDAFAAMSDLDHPLPIIEDAAVIKLETAAQAGPVWPPRRPQDASSSPTSSSSSSPTPPTASHTLSLCCWNELWTESPRGRKTKKPPDATDAKRARRSAIEKKSRQRRQHVLRTMRDEVAQLETVYAAVATPRGVARGRHHRARPATATTTGAVVDDLARNYAELTVAAHAFEQEQQTLQHVLQRYTAWQQTVTRLSDDQDQDDDDNDDGPMPSSPLFVWNSGVPPSASFHARFTPLTAAECDTLVRESYDEIQRFNKAEHFVSTGANFMGWTDKRQCDPVSGALQYGFTKPFPRVDAEALLLKTWHLFLDAPKFKDLSFDRSVTFRYEVLQQVSDDLIIVRQDHRIPTVEMTFASVRVLFRLQTPTGYTLCMRTIPSREIQALQEPHEYFYDVFHWTHFNHMYDAWGHPAGCELMSAGSIADQKHLKPTYWLFELVCSILRWESVCVGSLFLKQT